MSELTDDQLDGLFRKSAEEFQTPFDPAAWQDMKARLDANDQQPLTGGASQVKNILRWGSLSTLLLLLIAGGWSIYQSGSSASSATKQERKSGIVKAVTDRPEKSDAANLLTNERAAPTQSIRTPEQGAIDSGPAVDPEKVTPGRSTLESHKDAMPSIAATGGVITEKVSSARPRAREESEYDAFVSAAEKKRVAHQSLDKLPIVASNVPTASSRNLSKGNAPTTNSSDRKWRKSAAASDLTADLDRTYRSKARPKTDRQPDTNTRVVKPLSQATGSENDLSEEVNEPTAVSLPALTELAILPAKWAQPQGSINRLVEEQPGMEDAKIAPRPASMRGLSVRFAVSPDLSGIGLKNFARPGTNIGLMLEYRLASRWSVQAGLIQSTKVYKASTSDYEVPAGWWKAPLKTPESVDGRCTMVDIPINIRYDAVIKPRLNGALPSRWFVSGGVTSYIMENENYYYFYPPHTYNQPTEYSVNSGGYGFSNLNLSVGYERSISRRLSWQIEPFMKIPLKGVGTFKVRLLSTGTFFSLRYKL